MNNALLYDNFEFYDYNFTSYHHNTNIGSRKNHLVVLIKGHAKITYDNTTVHINEGDIFFIPQNFKYQSFWYGDVINFRSFGFLDLSITENQTFSFQTIHPNQTSLKKVLEIPTNGAYIDCKALSCFYDAMAEIFPTIIYSNPNKRLAIIEKAKKYITENPNVSIPQVADACKISEPYLYSLFKKYAQMTPNDFRQKTLCQKGITLLTTTDKTVEEISCSLGFSSSAYFGKVLRKHTNFSPREIRRTLIQ